MATTKAEKRAKIKKRIKKSFKTGVLRLSVYKSNKEIYAQIIDDVEGKTIASASSRKIKEAAGVPKTEQASMVGKAVAEAAVKAGVETVVFDRNGYLYHGRVKALADGARENGLKF